MTPREELQGAPPVRLARTAWLLIMLISCLALTTDAVAQVPPHYPGTICATPQFWCWAVRPGQPGTACACPSPNGWIPGVFI